MGKQKKIAKGQQNYQWEVVNFVISSAVYLSLGFGKPCHPLSLSFASYSMGREPLACEAKELWDSTLQTMLTDERGHKNPSTTQLAIIPIYFAWDDYNLPWKDAQLLSLALEQGRNIQLITTSYDCFHLHFNVHSARSPFNLTWKGGRPHWVISRELGGSVPPVPLSALMHMEMVFGLGATHISWHHWGWGRRKPRVSILYIC